MIICLVRFDAEVGHSDWIRGCQRYRSTKSADQIHNHNLCSGSFASLDIPLCPKTPPTSSPARQSHESLPRYQLLLRDRPFHLTALPRKRVYRAFHNAKVIVMGVINQYTKIYYYCPVVHEVCLSPGGLSKFGSMWSQEAPDQIEAGKVANAHTSATDVTSA